MPCHPTPSDQSGYEDTALMCERTEQEAEAMAQLISDT